MTRSIYSFEVDMVTTTAQVIINPCFLFALPGLTVTVLIFQTVTAQAPDFHMYFFSLTKITDCLRNL